MAERVLTLHELNRATLARQMLLERASLPTIDALKHLVGLQAQVPNPPYIGLWTRLRSFQYADLIHLIEQRQAVRATMMRATLHLMAAEDYALFRSALQPALTRALHGFFGARGRSLDLDQVIATARRYIQEQPRTSTEVRTHLASAFPNLDPVAMAYAVRTHLPLVQVYPGGAWGFTGSPTYALAEQWLDRSLTPQATGLPTLILRYLAAFGPATVKDAQIWSGLPRLQSTFNDLRPSLRTFRDEQGTELFDLPDAPLPSATITPPPRFLPEYDNLILSHVDRSRFVPSEHRASVFLTVGRVRSTFLVAGFVRGTWKIERTQDAASLILEPFEPLSAEDRAALLAEGEHLLRFVEDRTHSFEVHFAQSASPHA